MAPPMKDSKTSSLLTSSSVAAAAVVLPPQQLIQKLHPHLDFNAHYCNVFKESVLLSRFQTFDKDSDRVSSLGQRVGCSIPRSIYCTRVVVLLSNFENKDCAVLQNMANVFAEEAKEGGMAESIASIPEKLVSFTSKLLKEERQSDSSKFFPFLKMGEQESVENQLRSAFATMESVFQNKIVRSPKHLKRCDVISKLLAGEELSDSELQEAGVEETVLPLPSESDESINNNKAFPYPCIIQTTLQTPRNVTTTSSSRIQQASPSKPLNTSRSAIQTPRGPQTPGKGWAPSLVQLQASPQQGLFCSWKKQQAAPSKSLHSTINNSNSSVIGGSSSSSLITPRPRPRSNSISEMNYNILPLSSRSSVASRGVVVAGSSSCLSSARGGVVAGSSCLSSARGGVAAGSSCLSSARYSSSSSASSARSHVSSSSSSNDVAANLVGTITSRPAVSKLPVNSHTSAYQEEQIRAAMAADGSSTTNTPTVTRENTSSSPVDNSFLCYNNTTTNFSASSCSSIPTNRASTKAPIATSKSATPQKKLLNFLHRLSAEIHN